MSSSSSDEDNSRLKEALDPNFTLGNNGSDKKDKKTSLRRDKKANKLDDESGCLKTTSGFRQYVGDALSKRLDKLIDEVDCSRNDDSSEGDECLPGGVRLFSSSDMITKLEERKEVRASKREKPDLLAHRKNKKKKKKAKSHQKKSRASNTSSSSSDEEDFKEVAVTPDWVLQKKGVFQHPPKEADEVIRSSKAS
eukprot:TRINITY_DN1069_c0_g1_i2.p2 TRINITY_DN1069_c0_g1~~TRINITY_DN1069_c0_g1_i2.p2  ORF type:complete len:195 (-),score=59.15 TRINITY_DN1069_c0_g1_i2:72-656(-)